MHASDTRAFVCPGCGERMNVSPAMREAVLQNGCPFCTDAVESPEAFVS
ncbi:DUF7560 family zinc ribbon protein [Halovenus carboxidivorans]|nr:hypothetical protein [Halovenus carboxidivorans]